MMRFAPLLLLPLLVSAQDLSGKWSGSFDSISPDGEVKNETALLLLKQDGESLTGTAGPNEGKQWQIQKGRVSGDRVEFTLASDNGPIAFQLRSANGHLTGEATMGAMKAKIDVKRDGSKSLAEEIAGMDAVLFGAYNRGDLATMKSLFTTDLEFYHDKGGLTGYQQNIDSFQKTFEGPVKMRRELVEGSLEVYPIAGYGAVEIGVHRFYSDGKLTATAKFMHVWQKKDGAWRISRVVSYDHR